MTIRRALIATMVTSGALSFPGAARATHKQWIIKNGASQCSFTGTPPGFGRGHHLDLLNYYGGDAWAECPVVMAARWGARSGSSGATLWGASQEMWAALSTARIAVDAENSGSAIDCSLN